MKSYLFAVQDPTGREVASTRLAVDKVSTVTATKVDNRVVRILQGDIIVGSGETAAPADELALLRWKANDKLSTPVRKRVHTA